MPRRPEHIAQAQANAQHARWLLRMQPSDQTTCQWAATAAFYSALHLVEVYFDQYGIEHTDHRGRKSSMANPIYQVPANIYRSYGQMERVSLGARYSFMKLNRVYVETLMAANLVPIAQWVNVTV
jgi:hypothetical protein